MPTYEYACTSCGHQLEAVQSFTDDPLTECPACGGELRKVYAPVGIVLKGSGFYKTDSRAANGQRLGDQEGRRLDEWLVELGDGDQEGRPDIGQRHGGQAGGDGRDLRAALSRR